MTVQMQSGGADCGLFAIANANALAFGEPPGKVMYDQENMRHHLWQCLEKRKMTIFPVKLRRLPLSVVTSEPFHVYCICRMPEIFHNGCWVECSKCKEWYRTDTCISIPDSALCRSAVWHCMLCYTSVCIFTKTLVTLHYSLFFHSSYWHCMLVMLNYHLY